MSKGLSTFAKYADMKARTEEAQHNANRAELQREASQRKASMGHEGSIRRAQSEIEQDKVKQQLRENIEGTRDRTAGETGALLGPEMAADPRRYEPSLAREFGRDIMPGVTSFAGNPLLKLGGPAAGEIATQMKALEKQQLGAVADFATMASAQQHQNQIDRKAQMDVGAQEEAADSAALQERGDIAGDEITRQMREEDVKLQKQHADEFIGPKGYAKHLGGQSYVREGSLGPIADTISEMHKLTQEGKRTPYKPLSSKDWGKGASDTKEAYGIGSTAAAKAHSRGGYLTT